ncbi:MAG TPA: exopolysaccharide biosynthesis protein [Alphaproteobacteria bacterium]|nr:exopolysaccharide biosynthesis protein [Alphaproteobacteria bacterium]
MTGRHVKASEALRQALADHPAERLTVGEIVGLLGERAFGLVLLLFALPNCVPAPPGLGSILGLPLVFFGVQMARGARRPWLPGFIARRSFRRLDFLAVLQKATPALARIERVCRPRLSALTGPAAERFYGTVIVVFALTISLPVPLTNFVPAIGTALLALAILEEDGATALAGLAVGLGGLVLAGWAVWSLLALLFGGGAPAEPEVFTLWIGPADGAPGRV